MALLIGLVIQTCFWVVSHLMPMQPKSTTALTAQEVYLHKVGRILPGTVLGAQVDGVWRCGTANTQPEAAGDDLAVSFVFQPYDSDRARPIEVNPENFDSEVRFDCPR
jgi:hypothetical protein